MKDKVLDRNLGLIVLRGTSILLIFLLHYFYAIKLYTLGFSLSVFINCFVALSGYLSGIKTRDIPVNNYILKRISSLILPVWIIILLGYIIMVILKNSSGYWILLSHLTFINWFVNTEIPGFGHLWFISLILVCYLGIWVFKKIITFQNEIQILIYLSLFLFSLLINTFLLSHNLPITFLPYLWTFFIAYYLGAKNILISKKNYLLVAFLICLCFYIFCSQNEIGLLRANLYYPWLKTILALLLLMLLIDFKKAPFIKFLSFFDKYSFEFYLVHHPFLIGPFSLVLIFNNHFLILIISFSLSVILAIFFHKIVNKLRILIGSSKKNRN